jgi:hypothetical protein
MFFILGSPDHPHDKPLLHFDEAALLMGVEAHGLHAPACLAAPNETHE